MDDIHSNMKCGEMTNESIFKGFWEVINRCKEILEKPDEPMEFTVYTESTTMDVDFFYKQYESKHDKQMKRLSILCHMRLRGDSRGKDPQIQN